MSTVGRKQVGAQRDEFSLTCIFVDMEERKVRAINSTGLVYLPETQTCVGHRNNAFCGDLLPSVFLLHIKTPQNISD